eukprot:scaffold168961_cov40-Tisochrysis_lutea.AAC.2
MSHRTKFKRAAVKHLFPLFRCFGPGSTELTSIPTHKLKLTDSIRHKRSKRASRLPVLWKQALSTIRANSNSQP